MKFTDDAKGGDSSLSPSMRRVWIEIEVPDFTRELLKSPSMRRVWIEILMPLTKETGIMSPSMRRVWIEMEAPNAFAEVVGVTLHAEGVD